MTSRTTLCSMLQKPSPSCMQADDLMEESNMTTVREPVLEPVAILDLRPTQITVGMREVKAKRSHWRSEGTKGAGKFLGKHMIPAIRGPKGRYYVIDHHHLARALHDEGAKDVAITIIANLSKLDRDSFWFVMDNRDWTHPFDSDGRRRPYSDLPKSVDKLIDDPFRLPRGRTATRRRLRQGYDSIQRIPLGRFSTAAHEPQVRGDRFRSCD